MRTFRTRIRAALANEALQTALDNNAERRTKGRLNAFATLPDPQERRQQAHAVRADVIEHLEEYLEQFIGNAEQNGIIVHAKTGAKHKDHFRDRKITTRHEAQKEKRNPCQRVHMAEILLPKPKA
jgi:L-lactate dehydrogenase complex protein LldF